MNSEQWEVKNRKKEKWGSIKKLIINPATRRIVSADVVLTRTDRLLRVPWENFTIIRDNIVLRVPENQVHGSFPQPHDGCAANCASSVPRRLDRHP